MPSTKVAWLAVSHITGDTNPMEHEGDYEPGDTLIRIRSDTNGNVDVLVRQTVKVVIEIDIPPKEL